MLDALAHGKLKLTRFRPDSEREVLEDLLVSTVFGAWQLLPVNVQQALLRRMLLSAGLGEPAEFRAIPASWVPMRFWPHLDSPDPSRRYVEPDLLWQFETKGGATVLVVLEAKWDSGLMERQLEQQWRAMRSAQPDAEIWHLFLSRDRGEKTRRRREVDLAAGPSEREGRSGWLIWSEVLTAISMEVPALHRQLQPMMKALGTWAFTGVRVGELAALDWEALSDWRFHPWQAGGWPQVPHPCAEAWVFQG